MRRAGGDSISPRSTSDRDAALFATVASATIVAFQLAGRATRDALYLSTFDLLTLPRIVIVSSVLSALLSYAVSRRLSRVGPARLVPALFVASGLLLLVEGALVPALRPAAAIIFYLHFGSFGALLVSAFWALLNERFDPRTARRVVGQVLLGATVGGILGGLLATALPMFALFPLLAGLHLASGALVWGLASPEAVRAEEPPEVSPAKVLHGSRYLRGLLLLVVVTAMIEGLVDFVFKLRATSAGTDPELLLRLFARFYTVTSVLSIALQLTLLRPALARLGVARSTALLPVGVSLGAIGSLLFPGFSSIALARGTEIVLRNSVFRGAYELLFTPIDAARKRAAKLLIDVGGARLGDVAGGALIQLTLLLAAGAAGTWLLAGVVGLSAVAVWLAFRFQEGYRIVLARGLARDVPPADMAGATLLQTFGGYEITAIRAAAPGSERTPRAERTPEPAAPDAARVRATLASGLTGPADVERAITLLAWDEVAPAALAALRTAEPGATRAMVAHLADPAEDFTIRRRLVPALAERPEPAAFEGLVRALTDRRFEVRYRASRALVHLRQLDSALIVDADRILACVFEEIAVERDVWESRQLIDESMEPWAAEDAELLGQRAGRAMEHVFTLLSLVLPREPLRLAYRGLLTTDPHLRGTALEYLESVLPGRVREKLWPYLEPGAARARASTADEALQRLLASSDAIRKAPRAD